MAPGRFSEPEQAEAALVSGDVSLIGMARELMKCSEWPIHAAHILGHYDPFSLLPPDFAFRLTARDSGMDVHDTRQPEDLSPPTIRR